VLRVNHIAGVIFVVGILVTCLIAPAVSAGPMFEQQAKSQETSQETSQGQPGELLALYAFSADNATAGYDGAGHVVAGAPDAWPEIRHCLHSRLYHTIMELPAFPHEQAKFSELFLGPLLAGVDVSPDGYALVGYASNARIYQPREWRFKR
tara:strand:+ start:991 stop:1443 length:453 start_codon:yes stop_codon:yes gene_type:complete